MDPGAPKRTYRPSVRHRFGTIGAAGPPNRPLQRTWSSLTLGARPLDGKDVRQTRQNDDVKPRKHL
jgi:hypothetical protein